MFKYSLLATFLLLSLLSRAQQSVWEGSKEQLSKVNEEGKKKADRVKQWKNHAEKWGLDSNFNYGLSLSGRLNTNGWSGGVQYVIQQKHRNRTVWQLYFSEIKQEKEIKQEGTDGSYSYLGKSSAYIFGKINNAYTLQLGYGKEQMLFPSLMDGNVSVSLRYMAGPTLAMMKPYYLKLIYVDYNPEPVAHIQTERYSLGNDDHFLEQGNILGKERWSKGLTEIKYIPGLFGEVYFAIEPDRPKAFIKTIMIGGNAAFYTSKLEIMANRKAYPWQASFFVGLSLGKRWK